MILLKFILNIIVFSSSNRVCNLKKRGGGVVILVHKCIKAVQVEHLTHQIADEIDRLSIKIILPNINNIIICAVYRIPSYNKQLLFDILYNSFNSYNFLTILLCYVEILILILWIV